MKMPNFLKSILKQKPKTSNLAEEIKKLERMKEEIKIAKLEGKQEAYKKPEKNNNKGSGVGDIFKQMGENLQSWEKNDPMKGMFDRTIYVDEEEYYEPRKKKKMKKRSKKKFHKSSREDFMRKTIKEADGISPTF